MSEIDWKFWGQMPTASVEEALLLTFNIDPECRRPPPSVLGEYKKREQIVYAHVQNGSLGLSEVHAGPDGTETSLAVSLSEFGRWAQSLGWEIPSEFPCKESGATVQERGSNAVADGWPWGSHETALLRHLSAAAKHWWANYDPTDHTTAPRNEDVSTWLRERGVGEGMSDKMATILRVDGLPKGPRK